MRILLISVTFAVVLSACGYKGALYLPSKTESHESSNVVQ